MLHKKKTKEKHCLGFFRSFKWNLNSAFKSWFQFISLHTHIWMIEEYQKLEAGCFDLIFILFRNAIVSKVLIRFFFLYKNCLQVLLRKANSLLLAVCTIPSVILHFTIHIIYPIYLWCVEIVAISFCLLYKLCISFWKSPKTAKS